MKVCYTGGAVTDHGSYYAVATNAVELRIWFLTDDILRIRAGFDGDWDEASYSLTMTAWDSRTDELMKDCRKRVQPADNLPYEQYAHKYPSEMSGGQQQRIGILRALAASPPIVLMDEPFSALDPMTRAELQDEVHRLQLRFHKTIVFVTHDMDEAVKLADRICILQNGHVVQCDKPENILKHPANEYINSFIGKNRLWENPSFIRAEDIMCPRPITISQSRTVVQAVQLMRHYNIDSLLVTGDDNKFAGMVWLQDLIGIDQYSSPISSFLSDDYLSVRVDDSLSTVLEKVADYGEKDFGILPVLDAEGAIRGFLNRSSLLSTLSRRFIDEPVERDEQEGA